MIQARKSSPFVFASLASLPLIVGQRRAFVPYVSGQNF
jgi:hypothetical protein